MMRRRALTLLTLLLLALPSVVAQQLVWSVDFNSLFNNREGGDEARPDQTFVFTRISPELGVMLGRDTSNVHLLKGGVTWFQPLNDNLDGYKVLPVMYYQYRYAGAGDCWRVTVGQLPRTLLMERAPRYLWSDSMAYHQPNVRGALVQYERGASYAELYLDWRQMQSVSRREAFNVVVDGKWSLWSRNGRRLWLGGYFQYNHLAKRKNAPEGEGVNDDMTINPMLGLDMGHWSVPVHL